MEPVAQDQQLEAKEKIVENDELLSGIWGDEEPPVTKEFLESPVGNPNDPREREEEPVEEPETDLESIPVLDSTESLESPSEETSPEEDYLPEDLFQEAPELVEEALETLEEPPTEDDTVDSQMDELKLSDKQKHAFSQLSYEKRELQRQVAELKEQASGLAEQSVPSEVLEEKDEQIRSLEKKLGEVSLSESPEFQKTYDLPVKQKLSQITNLLVRSGLSQADARVVTLSAFQEKDLNARIDLLTQEAGPVSGPIIAMFEDVEALQEARISALSKWQETRAALKEAQKRESEKATWGAIEEVSKTVHEKLKKGGNFLYNDTTSDSKWNSEVSERVKAFRGVLQRNDMTEIAELIGEGLAFNKLQDLFKSERAKRISLEKSIKSQVSIRPDVGGSSTSPASQGPAKKDLSTEEILSGIWN